MIEPFKGTLIRYSTDTYPDCPTSGKPVPNGNNGFFEGASGSDTSFAHTRFGGGTTFYSAFAYDETSTFSPAIRARATPGDHAAPDVLLGILQNPYLTQYLDIYLVSPEPLDSASVTLQVSGASTPIRLLDPSENVWKADFKISLPSDSVELDVCAFDPAGNDTCRTAIFSTTHLIAEQGGTVSGPDGRVSLKTDPHALTKDAYVVVLPCEDPSEQGRARGLDDLEIAYLTDSGQRPAAYHIGPRDILNGSSAYLEFSYDEPDLNPSEITSADSTLQRDLRYAFPHDQELDWRDLRLILAQCHFETGEYDLAKTQVDSLNSENILNPDLDPFVADLLTEIQRLTQEFSG
jgi:hypothetical protein